jgi:hypothetical protein
MTQRTSGWIVAAGVVGSFFAFAGSETATVPFPQGYRQWTFLRGTMFGPKHGVFDKQPCEKPCTGGIMYFYANEKAMEGLRTGKFADGSVFADELLETHGHESGVATEGPRRGVGVMVKDSGRYGATGGWGYASFDRDSQTDNTDAGERKACFQCHSSRKGRDFVFTEYHAR